MPPRKLANKTRAALRDEQRQMMMTALNNDSELAEQLIARSHCTDVQLGVFLSTLSDSGVREYIKAKLSDATLKDPPVMEGLLVIFFSSTANRIYIDSASECEPKHVRGVTDTHWGALGPIRLSRSSSSPLYYEC
jgi:hypothetical protein